MATTEARLSASITTAIRKAYPDVWIFHPIGSPYQASGVPDLLICVGGLFVGIEVKNPRPGESHEHAVGRTTRGQRAQLHAIITAGGVAGVATSKQEALDLIRRAYDNHQH